MNFAIQIACVVACILGLLVCFSAFDSTVSKETSWARFAGGALILFAAFFVGSFTA